MTTPVPRSTSDPWAVPGEAASQPVANADVSQPPARGTETGGNRPSPWRRLQPRTTGEILDAGFDVLRHRFVTLVGLSACFALPLYALPTLVQVGQANLSASNAGTSSFETVLGFGSSGEQQALAWLGILGNSLALALVGVGVARLVTAWIVGSDPTFAETMGHVARRSPVLLGAWIIALLIKGLGLLLGCVGLLFVLPLLMVLSPVVAAEPLGPVDSVRRSWRLSRRRFGAMFGLTLISGFVSTVIRLVLGGIASVVLAIWSDASWVWVLAGVVGVVIELVLLPLKAAWASLAYVDLRVRTEGLDLELELDEVFGEP